MSTAESVADDFRKLTGAEPDAVYSAPGRVNLIGEHTDYNDGFVLPFAIPARTYAVIGMRSDGRIRVASDFAKSPVEVALADLETLFPSSGAPAVDEWAAYPLGVAWALLQEYPDANRSGVDITFRSEVPVGAGLSSSAALEGVTASALNEVWALNAPTLTLALAGRRAENEAVGAPTGIMDQLAVMFGQDDAATFIDCRALTVQSVGLGFAAAGLAMLVIDTKTSHAHSTGGYRARRESCELGAQLLGVSALRDVAVDDLEHAATFLDDVTFRRVRHIVTENQRVLDTVTALASDGPIAIGALLTASHASMRDDFEISSVELDAAVDAALSAGAIGARMTGGGFGGAAIALVNEGAIDDVSEAVRVAFADRGYRSPVITTVTPSAGPRRES